MKKYLFLFILLFTSKLCSQGKPPILPSTAPFNPIVSTKAISCGYLVYLSSLTSTNKLLFKDTIIPATITNKQPSGRFTQLYNSTSAVAIVNSWRTGDLKFDGSTTRMIVMFDSDYDYLISTLSSSKIRKLYTLYEKVYHDMQTGQTYIKDVDIIWHEYYKPDIKNKDWNLYKVNTSTP